MTAYLPIVIVAVISTIIGYLAANRDRKSVMKFHDKRPVNPWDHIDPRKNHFTQGPNNDARAAFDKWLKKELG